MEGEFKRDFYCPILKEVINFAYCYEINSVAFGLCKPSFINDVVDRKTAEPVCEKCENLQMTA